MDLSGVDHLAENAGLSTECRFEELTILVPRRFQVNSLPGTTFTQFHLNPSAASAKPWCAIFKSITRLEV